MNCEHVRARLITMLDGTDPRLKHDDEVRSHLEQCAECRATRESWEDACRLLAAARRNADASEANKSLPAASSAPIVAEAWRRLADSRRRWRRTAIAASVATGLASAALLLWMVRPGAAPVDNPQGVIRDEPLAAAASADQGEQRRRIDELDRLVKLLIREAAAAAEERDRDRLALRLVLQSLEDRDQTRMRTIATAFHQLTTRDTKQSPEP